MNDSPCFDASSSSNYHEPINFEYIVKVTVLVWRLRAHQIMKLSILCFSLWGTFDVLGVGFSVTYIKLNDALLIVHLAIAISLVAAGLLASLYLYEFRHLTISV